MCQDEYWYHKQAKVFGKACGEMWKEHMVTRKMTPCRERPNLLHFIVYVLNVLSGLI